MFGKIPGVSSLGQLLSISLAVLPPPALVLPLVLGPVLPPDILGCYTVESLGYLSSVSEVFVCFCHLQPKEY